MSHLVLCDEMNSPYVQPNDFQQNDASSHNEPRAMPTMSSAFPTEGLPISSANEKPILYLGSFQILAMPFSSGQLPPNFGYMPTFAPPSKKD